MNFIDILDNCSINKEITNASDKKYCTLELSRMDYAMLRWALKTKDAIDDVLDDELGISHKERQDRKK